MGEPQVKKFVISNQRGLHARASAKFVSCVEQFDAEVRVSKDGHQVVGDSIMGLMFLAAAMGSTITVSVSGPEAENCLDALASLIENKFDETS